jgi:hypothetical protein
MRPIPAEAGRGGIDDARVAGCECSVVLAEPLGRAQPHVVEEYVGRLDQPQQRLSRRRPLQIERDAAPVAVDI